MQAGFHRLGSQVEDLRGLLDAQSFDHPGDEYDPINFRKLVGGVLNELQELALCHGSFRVIGLRRERKLDHFRLHSLRFERRQIDRRPSRAQPAERFVDSDAGQPGDKRRVAAKIFEMGEGPDISLLNDVLGLAVVADDPPRQTIEALIVFLHDRAERSAVAGKRAPNQFRIVHGGQTEIVQRLPRLFHDQSP